MTFHLSSSVEATALGTANKGSGTHHTTDELQVLRHHVLEVVRDEDSTHVHLQEATRNQALVASKRRSNARASVNTTATWSSRVPSPGDARLRRCAAVEWVCSTTW